MARSTGNRQLESLVDLEPRRQCEVQVPRYPTFVETKRRFPRRLFEERREPARRVGFRAAALMPSPVLRGRTCLLPGLRREFGFTISRGDIEAWKGVDR